jgi:hypothetical protein
LVATMLCGLAMERGHFGWLVEDATIKGAAAVFFPISLSYLFTA